MSIATDPTNPAAFVVLGDRPCVWIPFLPAPPRTIARGALALAHQASRALAGWRWPVAAALAGALPFAISWVFGARGHQAVTAVLLAAILLPFILQDAWRRGLCALAITFTVHSALVFAATRADPARVAELVPGGEQYWQKQVVWIRTGYDPEYDLAAWVPAHAQLLAGTALYSYTSLGGLTFFQGFYEVDLMNYYTARLSLASSNAPLALLLGWHVWSILRGLAYLFITFEIVSLSFGRLTGRPPIPWRVRSVRWAAGLALIVADGVAKYLLLEPVRTHLNAMMS